jgi:hypothetical protein
MKICHKCKHSPEKSQKELGREVSYRKVSSATPKSPAIWATWAILWPSSSWLLRSPPFSWGHLFTKPASFFLLFHQASLVPERREGSGAISLHHHSFPHLPPRKQGQGRGELQIGTVSYPQAMVKDRGLWSVLRYWAVFPHVLFLSLNFIYLLTHLVCAEQTWLAI